MSRSPTISPMCSFFLLSALVIQLAPSRPLAFTQPPRDELPRVTAASAPFYPFMARLARIEGTVVLRITTDGKRVFGVNLVSGPPMLAASAEESAKTWQFAEHTPMTFDATFRYKWLPGKQDMNKADSGTIILRLPTEIEVSAEGIDTTTRDPAATYVVPGK